jgi:DNA-binding GntR family transcriptional regulator
MSAGPEDTSDIRARQRPKIPKLRLRVGAANPDALREPVKSLSETAYDRFIAALLSRRLTPGSFVSQAHLVAILEVPVAPLRDALRVLQAEGLVTIRARSGIEIIKPDFAMARHTYQIRAILERAAIRVYAETAPIEAIAEQEARHRAIAESFTGREPNANDFRELEKVDRAFHLAVIAALRNPLVEDTYRRIQSFLNLILLERGFSGPLMARTIREHLAILKACAERDPDAAELALEQHFDKALQRAIGLF